MPQENELRIVHIPQLGSPPTFVKSVPDTVTAKRMMDMLAEYDLFQYENKIKPDYSNMCCLEIYEDNEWCEWQDDLGYEIDQYEIKNNKLQLIED